MGAMVLHQGKIAELKTGEGKTLVASLAMYLNALEGRGVHLITVNDYLAKRDAQWYGRVLTWMGVTVGVLQHDSSFSISTESANDDEGSEYMTPCLRNDAYAADVTYGTNHEFGFDYLRDNMATDALYQVQRERHFAIVDEVDNILIDEARTPLIISGPSQDDVTVYPRFAALVPRLERETDFTVDEKLKAISLTESGVEKIERDLHIDNIYSPENFRLTRYMEAALKAQILYRQGPRLRGQGRRNRHRRRLYRPSHVRPPLVGRPAPGCRGQGASQDPAGVDHLRDDHPPELLPHVREAGRHDRDGRH